MDAAEKAEATIKGVGVRFAKSPLDPLLLQLVQDYTDDNDLSDKLAKLFQVLPAIPQNKRTEPADTRNLCVRFCRCSTGTDRGRSRAASSARRSRSWCAPLHAQPAEPGRR